MANNITEKFKLIFTSEDFGRITFSETTSGERLITVDTHGMKCSQARRFINNVINLVHAAFHLVVIHGYNHGTAIKDMLADNFENPHITNQYPDPRNLGATHMLLA